MSLCRIAQGREPAGHAPCLLRSPPSGQCCRLLKAGEEVLWHDECEGAVEFTLFDGKGGVKKINFGQASKVGFLLSGAEDSMQIRWATASSIASLQ